jgi:hypothetical protein
VLCPPALSSDMQFAAYDLCKMGTDILDGLRPRWKISPKMRGLFLMMSTPTDSKPDAVLKRMLASIVQSCHRSAKSGALMYKYYILVGKSGELYGVAEWAHEESSGRGITEGILAKFEYVPPSGSDPVRLTVEVMNTHAGTSFRFMAPALKALRDRGSIMLLGNFDYSNFTKDACWREVTAVAHGRTETARMTPPPPAIPWPMDSSSAVPMVGFDELNMTVSGLMDVWGNDNFMNDTTTASFPPPAGLPTSEPPHAPPPHAHAHACAAAPVLPTPRALGVPTPDANSVMESLRYMLTVWQSGSIPGTPC